MLPPEATSAWRVAAGQRRGGHRADKQERRCSWQSVGVEAAQRCSRGAENRSCERNVERRCTWPAEGMQDDGRVNCWQMAPSWADKQRGAVQPQGPSRGGVEAAMAAESTRRKSAEPWHRAWLTRRRCRRASHPRTAAGPSPRKGHAPLWRSRSEHVRRGDGEEGLQHDIRAPAPAPRATGATATNLGKRRRDLGRRDDDEPRDSPARPTRTRRHGPPAPEGPRGHAHVPAQVQVAARALERGHGDPRRARLRGAHGRVAREPRLRQFDGGFIFVPHQGRNL